MNTSDVEISKLQEKIFRLEKENELLRANTKKDFLAELLIKDLTNGKMTGYKEDYDVETENEKILEVKFSSLRKNNGNEWHWSNIYGTSKGKLYDNIILVGAVNEDYKHLYKDDGKEFVLFDVPYLELDNVISTKKSISAIEIVSRPPQKTVEPNHKWYKRQLLFDKYQITYEEMREKYRKP